MGLHLSSPNCNGSLEGNPERGSHTFLSVKVGRDLPPVVVVAVVGIVVCKDGNDKSVVGYGEGPAGVGDGPAGVGDGPAALHSERACNEDDGHDSVDGAKDADGARTGDAEGYEKGSCVAGTG